jgi:dolichol-phosphate mannosyltransferase
MESSQQAPRFAVVVPMKDEADNVAALLAEIEAACAPHGPFEAVVVDDGSADATPRALTEGRRRHPWLRVVRHRSSCGQSAAVATGVRAARAPLVCTIDGDGQNPPAEIPRLLAPLFGAREPALICGVRTDRADTASKRFGSRFANGLRRRLLRDGSPDTGCGLKAFPREAFLRLPYFDHMHRYLPSLFLREGWRVEHRPVADRPRTAGVSKYGNLQRALVGVLDLFGVWWLMRRRRVPVVEPVVEPVPDTRET